MINYDQDFYGWTQEQAGLLRAGRLTDLDIENLIEEVETMGGSEKRLLLKKRGLMKRLFLLNVHGLCLKPLILIFIRISFFSSIGLNLILEMMLLFFIMIYSRN